MKPTYKRELITEARTLREAGDDKAAMWQAISTTQIRLARHLEGGCRDVEDVQTALRVLAQAQPMGREQHAAVGRGLCGAKIYEGSIRYVCVLAWDHDGGCLPSTQREAVA